ncbi:MAG: phytanoyl-CoA dioxygenase family protein [candidate division Zixibacteria bacterium]|nr:phytanoyl-CoA dioxygenase family protein [candidate division Zixibacteria bacterium]
MDISVEERREGRLSADRLAAAQLRLRQAGYVVLENVLSLDWLVGIREAFDKELARVEPDGAASTDRRGGCHAPLCMPFFDPLIVENPIGLQIMESVMGEDLWAMLPYHTNTSWPGAGMQHGHSDTKHLFPEVPVVLPPSLMVLNIPVVDFTEENGSTEVWPGSHLIVDASIGSSPLETLERRAAEMPSVRLNVPTGAIVLRDMRVWHRGTPNRTDIVRTMISLVYFRQLHGLPDHLTHLPVIPWACKNLLSERAKRIFRYNPVEGNT